MKYLFFFLFLSILTLNSCVKNQSSSIVPSVKEIDHSFDIQAHRGGAALKPENTISSFTNAIMLGANTLEMDVCVTKDKQVVVSHDLYLNSKFVTRLDGTNLADSPKIVIFQLPYKDILNYSLGLKVNPTYPNADLIPQKIPLLKDVIFTCEELAKAYNRKINYSIELKVGTNGWDTPKTIEEYWNLVENELSSLSDDQVIIQCFDVSTLNFISANKKKNIRISFLTSKTGAESQLAKLNFIPDIYSPSYKGINKVDAEYCKVNNISIIPYVMDDMNLVNQYRIDYGIKGIITDYPNRFTNYK